MSIQRKQLSISAENIANANTTKTDEGGPYKPKTLIQELSGDQSSRLSFQKTLLGLRETRMGHLDGNFRNKSKQEMAEMGPDEEVVEQEKYRYEYDPHHPDADENGMVKYPDLDLVEEMTKMVSANRLYEANLAVVEAEKQVLKRALEI